MRSCFPRALRASFLAAALAAAFPGLAAEKSLTLGEAQRLAVERSRAIDARSLGVEASRERAVAAGELPDPVLSLGIENVPIEGPDRFRFTRESMTMGRIGVMQEITRGDKRELRAKRYALEAERGLAEKLATTAEVQRDTAIAWLEAWYAQAMAASIAEQRLAALQESRAAEAEYRAGRGSQGDVLVARTGLAMLDDRAAEMERRVKTARTMLSRWTGVAEQDLSLEGKPAIDFVHLEAHGAIDEAVAKHPEFAAMAGEEAVARAEARLARLDRRPDVSVELAYSVRGAGFGDMVSVGVSVPLPWDRANRQDREAAAKLATAEQARARREEALRQHAAEVKAMLHEWESNRGRIARYEREIVPLAAARAQAVLAAYRGGKSSANEVVAARRAELEARLQALELESETARTWARLKYLVPE